MISEHVPLSLSLDILERKIRKIIFQYISVTKYGVTNILIMSLKQSKYDLSIPFRHYMISRIVCCPKNNLLVDFISQFLILT